MEEVVAVQNFGELFFDLCVCLLDILVGRLAKSGHSTVVVLIVNHHSSFVAHGWIGMLSVN